MTVATDLSALDALRAQIDEIDQEVQALLQRRSEVVVEVGKQKGDTGGNPLRPAREAQIARTLLARHSGPMPKLALLRIWREIIAANCAVQSNFSIAVQAPSDRPGERTETKSCWDSARDHFGALVPLERQPSANAVIQSVRDGEAAAGVVAFSSSHEGIGNGQAKTADWWRELAMATRPNARQKAVQIVARLPLYGPTNAKHHAVDAALIAPVPFDASGDDKSLISVELDAETSLSSFAGQVEKAGGRLIVSPMGQAAGEAGRWCLVELDGYHAAASATIAGLSHEGRYIKAIGGYPTPIAL